MDREKWKNLLKTNQKKWKTDLFVVMILGMLLLLLSSSFFGKNPNEEESTAILEKTQEKEEMAVSTQRSLERRLESILSKVQGAGEIRVMVTMTHSTELIVAEETKSEQSTTTENGQQGDQRVIENRKQENKVILLENKDGSNTPLVLKEMEPKVEGIVIVAQGGDDILVKESLSRAAQALLNVPAHKVEILKMK